MPATFDVYTRALTTGKSTAEAMADIDREIRPEAFRLALANNMTTDEARQILIRQARALSGQR